MAVSKTEVFEKTAEAVVPCRVQWYKWLGSASLVGTPTITVDGTVTVSNASTSGTPKETIFLVGGGNLGKSVVQVTGTASDGKVEPVYFVFKVVSEP